jgi:hypothetical protein
VRTGGVISEGGGESLSLPESPNSPSPPISPEELKALPHPWILDEGEVHDEDIRNNNTPVHAAPLDNASVVQHYVNGDCNGQWHYEPL